MRAWEIPRFSSGKRAIYAQAELDELAAYLVNELPFEFNGETPRLACAYFGSRGEEGTIGEWFLQTLSSLMANRGKGKIEVYSRRRLNEIGDEFAFQAGEKISEESMVEMRKHNAVHAVISAKYRFRASREVVINCQLVDVATGKLLPSQVVRVPLGAVLPREPIWPEDAAQDVVAGTLARQLPQGRKWSLAPYQVTRGRKEFSVGTHFLEEVASKAQGIDEGKIEFNVRARDQLLEIWAEQRLQWDSLRFSKGRKAKDMELNGANVILTGYGERFSGCYQLNIQAIDVETARILAAQIILVKSAY